MKFDPYNLEFDLRPLTLENMVWCVIDLWDSKSMVYMYTNFWHIPGETVPSQCGLKTWLFVCCPYRITALVRPGRKKIQEKIKALKLKHRINIYFKTKFIYIFGSSNNVQQSPSFFQIPFWTYQQNITFL